MFNLWGAKKSWTAAKQAVVEGILQDRDWGTGLGQEPIGSCAPLLQELHGAGQQAASSDICDPRAQKVHPGVTPWAAQGTGVQHSLLFVHDGDTVAAPTCQTRHTEMSRV